MQQCHCVKSVHIQSFFWSVFSRIRTGCGGLWRKSLYSVWIRENTDQKKLCIWTLLIQLVLKMMVLTLIIFIFLSKTPNYMFLLSLYQQTTIKNYQNLFAKVLKDQCIGMNLKQKVKNKNSTNEHRYFFEPNFVGFNRLFVLIYLNRDNDVKGFKSQRYCLPKCIIQNYNVIINRKNFYNQPTDSGIKWYEKMRKLTTGQDEGYTSGGLLDYEYIHKLI